MDTQSVSCSQSQYGDGDGCTSHVYGCAQRNGQRIGIRIEAEAFAQSHVYRDVSSGAAGKESVNAGFADGGEHQRERVFTNVEVNDERIHHQRYEEVGGNEYCQQVYIAHNCRQASVADGGCHEAHDAERSKVDNPFYNEGDSFSNVCQSSFGSFVSSHVHSQTKDYSPCQNTDVVSMQERRNRIVNNAENQVMQNLNDAAGRCNLSVSNL